MNITTISLIIWRRSARTKSHCPFSLFPSNNSSRYTTLAFFNPVTPSRVTTSGVPKSLEVIFLIVSSNLNHFLVACGYYFHALAVHPHPTFTAPPVRSGFGIRSEICDGAFFAETVYMLLPLADFAEEPHCWYVTEFYMRLCLSRRFPSLGLHRGILKSSCLLILLIHTKHKYNKMKSWTDPTSSFCWRRTHPLGRQGKKRVTNSRAAVHKSWMVKCSPQAPGV